MSSKETYIQTLPPHVRSGDSLAKRCWGQLAALSPVFVAAGLAGHAEILVVLLTSLVSAVAFGFAASKIFRKKEKIRNGEAVLAAALLTIVMPARCSPEIVILGIFVAVFAAREFFGGTGAYPLHPVLAAYVFLRACFPSIMREPLLFSGEESVWILVGAALSGMMLLRQKQSDWSPPAVFMAGCFLCEALGGGKETPFVFFSGVLLAAFFFLADPVTLPLTRKGTIYFALGAAILSSLPAQGGFSVSAAAWAILFMNLLTPWLDLWFRPAPYRPQKILKATYPV